MTDSEDDTGVPVQCDVCETRTRVPLSDLADAIERHNETVHDGEAVAEVDPDIKAQLADLVVEDLGLLEEDS